MLGGTVLTDTRRLRTTLGADAATVEAAMHAFAVRHDATVLDVGVTQDDAPFTYPSETASQAARDIQRSIASSRPPFVAIVGDEGVVPMFGVDCGAESLYTDYFYGSRADDGLPDAPVVRILGTPSAMVRQLGSPTRPDEPRALFMCSEDTRMHLETRTFLLALQELGYASSFTMDEADELLPEYDAVIHFGHGNDTALSGRWQTYATADAIPQLPRGPIVFVDGCATAPPGSRLVRAFLNQGGAAYFGSSSNVAGMIPARYACELILHFLSRLAERPDTAIAELLRQARRDYVRARPRLMDVLPELLRTGRCEDEDQATHVATLLQWHLFGTPFAGFARGEAKPVLCSSHLLQEDVALDPEGKLTLHVPATPRGCVPVLGLRARWSAEITSDVRIAVRQNNTLLHEVRGNEWTIYQNVADTCIGGYSAGAAYHAYCLLPIFATRDPSEITLTLEASGPITVTAETTVDIWPVEHGERYVNRLEWNPASDGERTPVVSGPQMDRARGPEPVRVIGTPGKSSEAGYTLLDLGELYTRPHGSMRVGGGDNAGFATWFATDRVEVAGAPFRVGVGVNDVLVSPTNGPNQWTLHDLDVAVGRIHMLAFGYSRPESPLSLRILFADGTTEERAFDVYEWSGTQLPVGGDSAEARGLMGEVAFEFTSNAGFRTAAITYSVIAVPGCDRVVREIACDRGTFGLVAMTLDRGGGGRT
ncbi:hypothetical protein HOK31_01280 [Candidatus Poribacteria bacterium]|nr:hypothetical protein [Candidatus Poribacteria bacterium]